MRVYPKQNPDLRRLRSGVFRNQGKRGFTLVELLVVLGVIALLVSLLLPALARARDAGRATVCLSNLRQMATAAHTYANASGGRLPVGWHATSDALVAWDLTARAGRLEPGLLWQGDAAPDIQLCPEAAGLNLRDNWGGDLDDAYTGYNYNASFLAGASDALGDVVVPPAKLAWARSSSETAAFGDGQYRGGANKFMRAPRNADARDGVIGYRFAGTQGFRHSGRTNVAWLDGHASALAERHVGFDRFGTDDGDPRLVGDGCGFLGEDNRLYDLLP